MKAADLDTIKILTFLSQHQGKWCTWGDSKFMPTIESVIPQGTPYKIQLAKMKKLMKQGLVTGCDCGCRGDYEITNLGLTTINVARTQRMISPTNADLNITFAPVKLTITI